MRQVKFYPIVLILFLVFGCVTPKSTSNVHEGTNLEAYNKVYISQLQYNGAPNDQYGVRASIIQKLSSIGIRSVSETEVRQQNLEERTRTLFCSIQHNHTPDGMGGSYANVRIEMYDMNQELIYSGSGRYQGLSISGELNGATNQALKGFLSSYKKYDPSKKPFAVIELDKKINQTEFLNKSKEELEKYYDTNIENLKPIEGIWTSDDNNYQIGIFRDSSSTLRDFVGVVLKTEHPYWRPGQVKIELDETTYSSIYNAFYNLGDHTRQGTTAIISDEGLLQIELTQPNGSSFEANFIKNYPHSIVSINGSSLENQSEAPIRSSGSGFLISRSGLLVTNYHVIEDRDRITIIFPENQNSLTASVLLKDENNDIAVLKLSSFNFNDYFETEIPFSIADNKNVQVGQQVFTIGYPLGELLGTNAKLSDGIISSLYGINDDPRLFQISTPIQPGNSGGPLFNRYGELVGIVVASLNAKYFYEQANIIPQNVNFAVKSNYLSNIISMLPESDSIFKRQSNLNEMTLESQVETLIPFVVKVIAE